MKTVGDLTGRLRKLIADGAIGDGHAIIDGGRGRLRLLAGLGAHIFQERGLGKVAFSNVAGVTNTLPPADKMQQVVSVSAQGGVRQAANIFAVQVTIDPAHSLAGALLDDTNRTLCVVGGLLVDHTELHG
jgi:hypothetical protein